MKVDGCCNKTIYCKDLPGAYDAGQLLLDSEDDVCMLAYDPEANDREGVWGIVYLSDGSNLGRWYDLGCICESITFTPVCGKLVCA